MNRCYFCIENYSLSKTNFSYYIHDSCYFLLRNTDSPYEKIISDLNDSIHGRTYIYMR